ncbi:hypothetical protein [Lysobacter solisilvae (ex Woo and Kim 2020)]|uniref:DUF4892 domain-containing protein n=1 Tax=Agrilutibacter terrestris TaxID=2865112 RepID=A0A7H0G050_9GAMM|nr:hypothetical protein [Lysobacter terrestris]QNP41666.1 hypothetical protein H8B22_05520 [Lysobacter terrestris]
MRKLGMIAAACMAVAGASAWAVGGNGFGTEDAAGKEQLGRMLDARKPSVAEAAEARFEQRLAAQTTRESTLDVGDADSFGHQVRWLGLASGRPLVVRGDCTPQPGEDPGLLCMQVDPTNTGTQFGEFRDVAHMTLPARSTQTLLCHWLTPTMAATLVNYSGYDNRVARLTMQPSITVENEVLNAPGLVDPETGLPLNGKLDVFASSSQLVALLDQGEQVPQRLNSTRTCIGGYVNKRSLIEFYGLTEAQAREFFNKPTTLRLNMNVFASQVSFASVSYAIRFVGD